MLRQSGAALGAGLVIGVAGCSALGFGSGESDPVDGVLVRMTSDFVYDPDSVTIPAGETVVWRTEGFTPHTVTAYEDGISEAEYFASGGYENEQAARDGFADGGGEVGRGEEYSHTFEVVGTYEYFCIPHESSMVGTVVVEEV